jgi:predicted metalloprotease with PDZ domain
LTATARHKHFCKVISAEKRPGDKIKLTVFRFDELRDIEITLGGRAPQNYEIIAVANPTDEQKRLYQSYFGTELK